MINKAKIISITSVKGGTGKTINTLNLAGTFYKMNKKVLIIDLDLYSADIVAMLDIDPKTDLYTLYEDMSNNSFDSIEDYTTHFNEYIDIISAPKDPRYASKINAKFLNLILYKVKNKYDVILLDMSYILNEINLVAMDNSDYIVYILNNSPMDIKNMKTMISILNDMDKKNYKIVLYSKDNEKDTFTKFDINTIVSSKISYSIPKTFYLKNIDKYILEGKILTLDNDIIKHKTDAIKIYDKLAIDLLQEETNE